MNKYYITIEAFVGFGRMVSLDFKVKVYHYVQRRQTNGQVISAPASKHFKFFAVSKKIAQYEIESDAETVDAPLLNSAVVSEYASCVSNLWNMADKAGMPWLSTYLKNEWAAVCKDVEAKTSLVDGSEAQASICLRELLSLSMFWQQCAHFVDEDGKGFPL